MKTKIKNKNVNNKQESTDKGVNLEHCCGRETWKQMCCWRRMKGMGWTNRKANEVV